ncbi:MAG: nucleotide sugar dehydrogenase, partial [Myxococcota bacterium]|nr:nucleotide sugar dehydrogenase [Myxococcota bacterium]
INPGDEEHSLEHVVKVVAADSPPSLERVVELYAPIVPAGLFRASSIRVAEAAKVIENVQRDLNVALMNELSILFEHLGLATHEVLAAAKSKWNFIDFCPGLVGGHCIGVDPYYLTAAAEAHGYHPEVILAGRRINESMGRHVAQRVVKQLMRRSFAKAPLRIAVLGLAFKADTRDLRNTRVADLVDELRQFGAQVMLHDPLVDPQEAAKVCGAEPLDWRELEKLDAIILAVPHAFYRNMTLESLCYPLGRPGLLFDVKAHFAGLPLPPGVEYAAL